MNSIWSHLKPIQQAQYTSKVKMNASFIREVLQSLISHPHSFLALTWEKKKTQHFSIGLCRRTHIVWHIPLETSDGFVKYLNNEDGENFVHAFVTSRLDCCNSILYGIPDSEIAKLQRLQNTEARLVARVKKIDHITPVLQKLHWDPVKSRINYKILLLTFKALNGLAPSYLSELLDTYRPSRNLRSSGKHLLTLRKLTLWTMMTELSPFVHQNSGTIIFQFTLDRPNPYQDLNLTFKLTYLIIVSLIIFLNFAFLALFRFLNLLIRHYNFLSF